MLLHRLLNHDSQSYHQHTTGRIERVLTDGGVDATIDAVEEVVDAKAWIHLKVTGQRKMEGGVQVPEAKTGSVLIAARVVGLRLQASVQVDVQGVTAPVVVIVGGDGGGVADAAVERLP